MSDIIAEITAELVDDIAEVDIEFPYKGDTGDTGTTDWNGLSNKPDTFPPSTHTHDERYYTETETDALLLGKSDTTHNHDERYYTESEVDSQLGGKVDKETGKGLSTNDYPNTDKEIVSCFKIVDGMLCVTYEEGE